MCNKGNTTSKGDKEKYVCSHSVLGLRSIYLFWASEKEYKLHGYYQNQKNFVFYDLNFWESMDIMKLKIYTNYGKTTINCRKSSKLVTGTNTTLRAGTSMLTTLTPVQQD